MSGYFEAYDSIDVHELMLKDAPRMNAYKEAILKNRDQFENKVVLDVGSGTGILSMFAVQAGAQRVYAVEATGGFVQISRELIEQNSMNEKISVIHGKMEEVELPEKVDIIISEWMGFYLLHESMLDSVLAARDRWLKPGGLMLPSMCYLYCALYSDSGFHHDTFGHWSDFHGLDFSPFASLVQISKCREPQVMVIEDPKDSIVTDTEIVAHLDLTTITKEEIREISTVVEFNVSKSSTIHGIAFWFECFFVGKQHCSVLSTSPFESPTHWKQTVVLLADGVYMSGDTSPHLRIQLKQSSPNPRQYEIDLEFSDEYDDDEDDEGEGRSSEEMKRLLIEALMAKYDQEGK